MVRELKGKSVKTYKGITIYDDGVFYIYTGPKGTGRMDFTNIKEAMEYIDEQDTSQEPLVNRCKHQYRIDYTNSVNYYAYTYVSAYTPEEAQKIAEKILGQEIRHIDEIVQLPD